MVADDKTAIQLPKMIEVYQDASGKSPFEKWRQKQKGNRGAALDEALHRHGSEHHHAHERGPRRYARPPYGWRDCGGHVVRDQL